MSDPLMRERSDTWHEMRRINKRLGEMAWRPRLNVPELKIRLESIRKNSFKLEFRSKIESLFKHLDDQLAVLHPKLHGEPFSAEKKTKFANLSRKHSTVSFLSTNRIRIKVEYSTTGQTEGMWWWKSLRETGTLLLESEFDTELICFSLLKVDSKEHFSGKRDHIPEADIYRVADCLERFVVANNFVAQDEKNLLRIVTQACDSQILSYNYLLHRDEYGYLGFQTILRDYYKETLEALNILRREVLETLEELESRLNGEDVNAILSEYVDSKKIEVDEISDKLEKEFVAKRDANLERLNKEETSFNEKLTSRESELEDQYQSKFADLERKQVAADTKLVELTEKLKDHRIKIHEEFYKIAPKLAELFPDVKEKGIYNHSRKRYEISYETNVDGNLRTFYSQKLRLRIENNPHTSVDQCLQLITLFRNNCFARNRRPLGNDIRQIFIGLYCVIEYLANYDVPLTKIISLINENGRQKGQAKLGIEQLLEQSLGCDFDMKRFKNDVHGKDVQDRKGLKIK